MSLHVVRGQDESSIEGDIDGIPVADLQFSIGEEWEKISA